MKAEISFPLHRTLPNALGVGALLKNRVGWIEEGVAYLSEDFGALVSPEAVRRHRAFVEALKLSGHFAVGHDLHPDFPSSFLAMGLEGIKIPVQHQAAHIYAVMAEYGEEDGVLGIALDGFGLGLRGEAWGGELLLLEHGDFKRVGHLRALPQPGGDLAARAVWRMGAGALWALGRGGEIASRYASFQGADLLEGLLDKKVNTPMTSSAGRLFDAACGLLDVVPLASREGEAPMTLEKLAETARAQGGVALKAAEKTGSLWSIVEEAEAYEGEGKGHLVLDFSPLLERLSSMAATPEEGALLFHEAFISGVTEWIRKAAALHGVSRVRGGGGCFFNRFLREDLIGLVRQGGLDMRIGHVVSCSDAAIGIGQAYAVALSVERAESARK